MVTMTATMHTNKCGMNNMTHEQMLMKLQLMLICLHNNEVPRAQKLFHQVMWGLRERIEEDG